MQVVYRFAPAGSAYGRGYLAQMEGTATSTSAATATDGDDGDGGEGGAVAWPAAAIAGMTPAQR